MIHTFPVVCTNVDNYLYLVRVSSPKLRKLNPKEIFDYEINKMIGAVGGAVALGLCWPLAVGQIGESAIKDGLNNFESSSTKAELVNYQRGYLSSQMQTRYKITDPTIVAQLEAEGIPTEILVDSTLTHGLMGVSAVSTLPQFPEFPLQILSNTKLNGNTDYTVKLEQWNYVFQGEEPVAVTIEPSANERFFNDIG